MGDPMHTVQVLTLLLALSGALNVAFSAGGAGAASAVMAIFFGAVSAYR
jgi:hypothetical protein